MNLHSMRNMLLCLLLCSCCQSFAQCPASVAVVVSESRCRENGSITVNVLPVGDYSYEISSNSAPLAQQSTNVFSGLAAGNYSLTIRSTGCADFNQAIVVPGSYQDPGLLTGTATNIVCPGTLGSIRANQPANGRQPYSYAIVAGPVLRPVQGSLVFDDLPAGQYSVQALDSCGVVRTSQLSVAADTGDFEAYVYNWEITYLNCNDLLVPVHKGYLNTSSHSMLRVWYVSPSGDTLKLNTFNSAAADYDTLQNRAREYGDWQVIVADDCGRTRVSTFKHLEQSGELYIETFQPGCSGVAASIYKEWRFGVGVGYIVRSCTTGDTLFSEYQAAGNGNLFSASFTLQYDSCYLMEEYNDCGASMTRTFHAPGQPPIEIEACAYQSCNDSGKGDIWLQDINNAALRPVNFTIVAGEVSEVGKTTRMVDRWQNSASFTDLPAGTYSISITDACGRTAVLSDIVVTGGLKRTFEVTQSPNCSGDANLHVTVTSNQGSDCNNDYYLSFVDGTAPNIQPSNVTSTNITSTAIPGTWEADYFNVAASSVRFTIRSDYGCSFDTTVAIQAYHAPTLANINGYVCIDNGIGTINYNVSNGKAPFRFRIKNAAATTWGDWQDSSFFTNITAGVYDVNVEDGCPNGTIRSLNFLPWSKSDVNLGESCASIGLPITLSASTNVGFVQYDWLFNNTVVGTGPNFTIPSFSNAAEGIYTLRQTFRGGLCTDSVSKWVFSCAVLPLTLGEFSAQLLNEKVQLNWTTLADVDGLQFIVERSADGIRYQQIGTVPNNKAVEGSLYRFIDGSPGQTNYYRIGYYTSRGNVNYSHVVTIKKGTGDRSSNVRVTPTPFRDKFQVQISVRSAQPFMIKLYDAGGKEILQRKVMTSIGENSVAFDEELRVLPSGYYILEVSGEAFTHREKILKQ